VCFLWLDIANFRSCYKIAHLLKVAHHLKTTFTLHMYEVISIAVYFLK
jgi:hypothetical protein